MSAPAIIDCFTFATELDILEFRLDLLADVVDRFVIAEAPRTHSGLAKPLHFAENANRFKRHAHKITHIVVDDLPPPNPDRWVPENFQRNALARALGDHRADDLVLVTDVDEVPDPNVLGRLRREPFRSAQLAMRACFYRANWQGPVPWTPPRIARLDAVGSPQDLRMSEPTFRVPEAGAHFSYLMDVAGIRRKLDSIAEGPNAERPKEDRFLVSAQFAGLFPPETLLTRVVDADLHPVQRAFVERFPEWYDSDGFPPIIVRRCIRKYFAHRTDARLPDVLVSSADELVGLVAEKTRQRAQDRPRSASPVCSVLTPAQTEPDDGGNDDDYSLEPAQGGTMMNQFEITLGPGDDYVRNEPAFAILRDRIGPKDTVLDIGCGFGNVGRFLSLSGASVDGIEPDDERAAAAESALRRVCHRGLEDARSVGDLRDLYSVVTLLDVVEHFADPLGALRRAIEFLAPGGRLFLFVPNSAHWSFRKKMLRGNWAYSDWGLFDRTHLRFFDISTAAELCRAAGLSEVHRWYTSPGTSPIDRMGPRLCPSLFAFHILFELQVDAL